MQGGELRWARGNGNGSKEGGRSYIAQGVNTLELGGYHSASMLLFPHPAWPLVDGALLVSKRRSPAPDDLLTFVRPLCRPVGDPKPIWGVALCMRFFSVSLWLYVRCYVWLYGMGGRGWYKDLKPQNVLLDERGRAKVRWGSCWASY